MSHLFTSASARRLLTTASLVGAAVLVAGCGPESPPCNDPKVIASVQKMIRESYDQGINDLKVSSQDVAPLSLESPSVTAYDDKLKIRSCTVDYTIKPTATQVADLTTFISVVTNPLVGMLGSFNPFGALAGNSDTPLKRTQRDVSQFVLWNSGPTAPDQIRKTLNYKVQMEEGTQTFFATTNVEMTGSMQYYRLLAQSDLMAKEQAVSKAKEAKETAQKQAEIDRLSEGGKWRKAVYVLDFAGLENQADYCFSRGVFCFRGRDSRQTGDALYYELDMAGVGARGQAAFSASRNLNQPVCLVGVKKTGNPAVFTARGWSTFVNEKGEAADCLPGAEKSEWNAKFEPTQEQAAGNGKNSTGTASSANPSAPATSTGKPASATNDLMSIIARYEMCGEEALCLFTSKGNKIVMNVSTIEKRDLAMLDSAVKEQSALCLREVARSDAKSFTAEGLAKRC